MGPRAARIAALLTIALVLIAKDKDWRLSPAYDLTPAPVIAKKRRDMAMACGDMGRFANAKNILSQHARFLLKEEEAAKIVNDMVNQVRATWYNTAPACGVSENDAEAIRGAFLYEGFFHEPTGQSLSSRYLASSQKAI